MDDLISRQAAIDAVNNYFAKWAEYTAWSQTIMNMVETAQEAIKDILAEIPERKKGEWIDKSGGVEGAWNYCSVCGEQAIDLYDFCPNCGADMRGTWNETN